MNSTTAQVSTDSFYWASRMIAALSDAAYSFTASHIERYQNKVAIAGHRLIREYDQRFMDAKDTTLEEANEAIAAMLRKETDDVLDKVLYEASMHMKNAFARSDA